MGKRRIKKPKTAEPIVNYQPITSIDPAIKACTSKTTYYSLEQAQEAALMARVNGSKNIYEYACRYCDNWHIGHRFSD